MTVKDLIFYCDIAIEALELNRELIDRATLDYLSSLLTHEAELKKILNIFVDKPEISDKLFLGLTKFVEVEKKFLETNLTNRTIQGINRLKNRPIVLRLLASLT